MSDKELIKGVSREKQTASGEEKESLLERIKILQSLPEEVVVRFLKSKGMLRGKNVFKNGQ